jgi:hypothetical protein
MIGVSTRIIITVALVVAAVGAVDALVSREWDLLVVFLLVISLQASLWLRLRANRIPVTLRPDLARRLDRQSQRGGEPFDDILDRAVAWYESGLYAEQRSGG